MNARIEHLTQKKWSGLDDNDKMRISKVVVCGTKQSGKTSILEQVIYGNAGPFQPTKEDVYEVNVETDRGTIEHIRLYDTEGVDQRWAPFLHFQLFKIILIIASVQHFVFKFA